MIDEADRAAIKILASAVEALVSDPGGPQFDRFTAIKALHHAVKHLAYPDRDTYPKVRGSKKGDPIVRVWGSDPDLR